MDVFGIPRSRDALDKEAFGNSVKYAIIFSSAEVL